jgi:Pentapeptide repeats (9 copies)
MSIQQPPEESIPNSFICDCEEFMRQACLSEGLYKEKEGKRYCVLHYPGDEKAADFQTVLKDKLMAKDYNFNGVWFPKSVSFKGLHLGGNANFRSASFSGDADFGSASFGANADFHSASFSGNADFGSASFRADADFNSADFGAAVAFRSASFRHEVDFRSASFSREADFTSASFSGNVDFGSASFGAATDFSSASFSREASFNSASFSAIAEFKSAKFSAAADFIEASFNADADFYSASFSEVARFISARFSGDAGFHFTSFGAIADFSSANFSNFAHFGSARFGAVAYFRAASFGVFAYFSSASFSAIPEFRSAKFSAAADFSSARFSAGADFHSASFSGKATFGSASFGAVADFSSAEFSAIADFNAASFSTLADFRESTFKDYFYFAGEPKKRTFGDQQRLNFQFAHIEKPDRVSFHTIDLKPHWFINVDSRKFEFTDVEFHYKLRDELKSLKKADVGAPHRLLAIACRQLADNAEANHRYREASRLRYSSFEARRIERFYGFVFWRLEWWYWLASDYGERVFQAFIVFVMLIGLFAIGFKYSSFEHLAKTEIAQIAQAAEKSSLDTPNKGPNRLGWDEAARYSINVSILQKPDPKPRSSFAKWLVIIETVLGPAQAALLALALRRRFMR